MKHTPDLSTAAWRKSRYSDGGDNNCLEVADGLTDLVAVRDSKVPEGQVLAFGAMPWTSFLALLRHTPTQP